MDQLKNIWNRIAFPPIFRKLDHYLLTHHPVIWRTRGHYFFFYSFIVGNILAFTLPFLTIHRFNLLSEGFFEVILVGLFGLSLFACCYWIYTQVLFKLKSKEGKNILASYVVYFLCISSLFSNFAVMNFSTACRVSSLYSAEEFLEDQKLAEAYNHFHGLAKKKNARFFYMVNNGDFSDFPQADWEAAFSKMFRKYGLSAPNHGTVSYGLAWELEDRMEFVQDAQLYMSNLSFKKTKRYNRETLFNYNFRGYFGVWVGAVIILPITLFLFSTSGFLSILLALFCSFIFSIVISIATYSEWMLNEAFPFQTVVAFCLFVGTIMLLSFRTKSLGTMIFARTYLVLFPVAALFFLEDMDWWHYSDYVTYTIFAIGALFVIAKASRLFASVDTLPQKN